MKVLVTGGKGFVGKYLVKMMEEKGWEVLSPSKEFLNVISMASFDRFSGIKIDTVIHLAALLMIDNHNPADYFRVNTIGTFNALEFCRKNGIKKFVFAMTHSDQNQCPTEVLDEDENCCVFGTNSFEDGKNALPFIVSKVAALKMVDAYQRQGIIPDAVSLRLSNIRGFGSRDTQYDSPFHQFIRKARAGEDIPIWGFPPKTFRDLIYIKDVCSAFIAAVEKEGVGGVYNIGSGVPMTIMDEAKAIINVFSDPAKKSRIAIQLFMEELRTRSQVFSIEKAKRCLDWEPKFTYEQGLRDFKQEAGW